MNRTRVVESNIPPVHDVSELSDPLYTQARLLLDCIPRSGLWHLISLLDSATAPRTDASGAAEEDFFTAPRPPQAIAQRPLGLRHEQGHAAFSNPCSCLPHRSAVASMQRSHGRGRRMPLHLDEPVTEAAVCHISSFVSRGAHAPGRPL